MIRSLWRFCSVIVLLTGVVPRAAAADVCSNGASYERNIELAEQAIVAKDLEGAAACLGIAVQQSERQSARYWYTQAMLEIARNNGKPNKYAGTYLRQAADVAGADSGWYRIELAKFLMQSPKRVNTAFSELNKVSPALAQLASADYYINQSADADWERGVGHLENLEQLFRTSDHHTNLKTVLGLRAAVRASQIDEVGLGSTKDSLIDAVATIEKARAEEPQSPLAGYTLGFLSEWLSHNSPADLPPLREKFGAPQLSAASALFTMATPTISIILDKDGDPRTTTAADELAGKIIGRFEQRLTRLQLMDVEKPVVSFPADTPYSNVGTAVGSSNLRVWIPLDVTDDVALTTLEFSVSWVEKSEVMRNYPPVALKDKHFKGLVKLELPRECSQATGKGCRIKINARDHHNRISDPLEFYVRVKVRQIGAESVYIAGIEEYADPLRYPTLSGLLENDVARLGQYFRDKRGAVVHTVSNQQVNGDMLDDMFMEMRKLDGYVLFFFSGHGDKTSDGTGRCIITHNGRCKEVGPLMTQLSGAHTKYIGVIVDACYVQFSSQALAAGLWSPATTWDDQRMLISAASREETAKMRDRASVFLNAFLDVISSPDVAERADIDKNGFVSLAEAYDEARRIVSEKVPDQRPSHVGWASDFVIAEVPLERISQYQLSRLSEIGEAERRALQDALIDKKHPASLAMIDLLVDFAQLKHGVDPSDRSDREVNNRIVQLLIFYLNMEQRPIIVSFGG